MASQLPKTVTGLERQMMISDVMTRTDETTKMKMLALVNHFLSRMSTLNASDIDMGGYGSQGYIWYRVYGSKKADPSLGKYLPDEINILIQSIIGERQRAFLFENRNLDFSHMLYMENIGFPKVSCRCVFRLRSARIEYARHQ